MVLRQGYDPSRITGNMLHRQSLPNITVLKTLQVQVLVWSNISIINIAGLQKAASLKIHKRYQ